MYLKSLEVTARVLTISTFSSSDPMFVLIRDNNRLTHLSSVYVNY